MNQAINAHTQYGPESRSIAGQWEIVRPLPPGLSHFTGKPGWTLMPDQGSIRRARRLKGPPPPLQLTPLSLDCLGQKETLRCVWLVDTPGPSAWVCGVR